MMRPTKLYWKARKHVLRYLKGTTQFGFWYRLTEGVKLQGFTDAYWARSPSDKKSTSGGIFSIGSAVVSWYSKKQRSVALSSVEPEYMVAKLYQLSENPVFHDCSKHIDIWYHHLGDCVLRRIMLLDYIPTKEKDADILTKVLSRCKFKFHRDRIGVVDNLFLVEREC
eukprot:PITA_03575